MPYIQTPNIPEACRIWGAELPFVEAAPRIVMVNSGIMSDMFVITMSQIVLEKIPKIGSISSCKADTARFGSGQRL